MGAAIQKEFKGHSMGRSSRRGFLMTASATTAALAVSSKVPAWAAAAGKVDVWATFRDQNACMPPKTITAAIDVIGN
jgi:hypothetical protein